MATFKQKVALKSLMRTLRREIPSSNNPEWKRDAEFVDWTIYAHNRSLPEYFGARLDESAKQMLVDYVQRYGAIYDEMMAKTTTVRQQQTYWGKIKTVIPFIPMVASYAKKVNSLEKEVFEKVLGIIPAEEQG
jgi:hypothetical protein